MHQKVCENIRVLRILLSAPTKNKCSAGPLVTNTFWGEAQHLFPDETYICVDMSPVLVIEEKITCVSNVLRISLLASKNVPIPLY